MLQALGAASQAIDLLKMLAPGKAQRTTTGSSTASGFAQATDDSAPPPPPGLPPMSGASAQGGWLSPQTMNALFSAQSDGSGTDGTTGASGSSQTKTDPLQDLFDAIDADGDGSITQSEFESALGAGGTNTAHADSVFDKLDKDADGSVSLDELSSALKGKGRHRHAGPPPEAAQTDPLLKALDDAAEAARASRKASSSYLSVGQAVQQPAQIAAAAGASTLSVSV